MAVGSRIILDSHVRDPVGARDDGSCTDLSITDGLLQTLVVVSLNLLGRGYSAIRWLDILTQAAKMLGDLDLVTGAWQDILSPNCPSQRSATSGSETDPLPNSRPRMRDGRCCGATIVRAATVQGAREH